MAFLGLAELVPPGIGGQKCPGLHRGRIHFGQEPVVQFLGRVVAGGLEFGLEGGDLDEAGKVATGADGDDDVGDVHAENFHVFLLHAQAIHILNLVPGFEGDDEVHPFLMPDGPDTEHGGDVDDANAAHFHVVAGQGGAGAIDLAPVQQGDLGDVIGHQAVTALDEGQHTFAFADAALALDDDAHA